MEETRDLLVEIGTEELPPTALRRLSEAFADSFRAQLDEARLGYSHIEVFATPRRLALLIRRLDTQQPDQEAIRRGPALTAAYDVEGRPTKAATGFARSCGVDVSDLETEKGAKGVWLIFRRWQPGRTTGELVIGMVEQALTSLPIPKRMRWGDRNEEFVRPVHWVTLLFGGEVIKGNLFGVNIGAQTRGHRFHHPDTIFLDSASAYAEILRTQGWVEPSFARRRDSIMGQVRALASQSGGTAVLDDTLLDEVTALCEWPIAIMGSFDEGFLDIPPEALIETMQKNQKYFPIMSSDGRLLPRFITVSNIESRDPDQVRKGNERVIRPRFADAAFFWQQDLRQPLAAFAPRLKEVVFQEKLGTLADKAARVGHICRHIAGLLDVDEELAARSAHLAQCDLIAQMISEFPKLQGIMGRYYADKSGEHPCIVAAMEEQYLPRQAGDRLPLSDCGRILSIAAKLDTLVGIFAIGQRPTGIKDPYALRRAAIGLLRILIETPLPLDLRELLEYTAEELRTKLDATDAAAEVFDYAMERLKGYYQDRGIGNDVVDSVLASGVSIPSDIHLRILAVETFRRLPEAEALTAANKRIRNILRKSEEHPPARPNPAILQGNIERGLVLQVAALEAEVSPLIARQDYEGVLKALSRLRENVDAFFDNVLVMTDDPGLRQHRLALLRSITALFLGVADISRLR